MNAEVAAALIQYGAVGAMLAIVTAFARTLVQREQRRSDRLEGEVTRLNSVIQEKTIPALVTATQVLQESQQLMQRLQHQRDIEINAMNVRALVKE